MTHEGILSSWEIRGGNSLVYLEKKERGSAHCSLSSQLSGILSSGSSTSLSGLMAGVRSSNRLPVRKGIWSTVMWYVPSEWITVEMM